MNYGKSREILNKFIIEHNINFSYDKFEYLTVFYDIETFVDEPDQ